MSDLVAKEKDLRILKAKALFFNTSYSPERIASLVGLDISDIRTLIFGPDGISHTSCTYCWFYQKEIAGVGVGGELFREVEPVLISITKASTLSLLMEQIEKLHEKFSCSDDILTVDDIKKLTDIFTNIDKIDRLEQGRATSITSTELDRMDAVDAVRERRIKSDYIITQGDYNE